MPNVSFRLNGVFSLFVCVFYACLLFLATLPVAVHAADPAHTLNAPAQSVPGTPPLVRDALQAPAHSALAVAQPALPATEEKAQAATTQEPFISLPFFWFEDQKGALGLADIIKLDPQTAFQPFGAGSLPRRPGTIWLRVELPQSFPPNPVLNVNTRLSGQLPGKPQIWLVSPEGKETIVRATGVGLYPLPLPAPEGTALYIQIPGLPGVGFAPLLMSQDSLSQIEDIGDPALLALLAIVLFLCLLRGLAERKEWRFWAAIYTAAILVYAFWGLPATPHGVLSRWDLPGLFAPGVALLMLPHIGRQLMHTRSTAPVLDMLFILLALPGIALSALPLLPDYAWGLRYLPLWPLYCVLLLLPAFIACLRRIPGSGRYVLLCLLPPLGMLALYPLPAGLEERLTPGLISLFPQGALTLSCLLAALFRTPRHKTIENSKTDRTPHSRTVAALRLDDDPLSLQTEIPVTNPLALSSKPSHRTDAPGTLHSLTSPIQSELPTPHTEETTYLPSSLRAPLTSGHVERVLRAPLDTLLREICILDQAPLPLEYRSHIDALSRASRSIIGLVADLSQPPLPEFSGKNSNETFDINQLLLEIHDSIEEQAEQKNLGLTWFTAPHLPRYYEGRRQRLFDVLKLLAESAVLSTDKGMIQIRAQRVQDSTDPGHLQFTISDTGQGIPPYTRSSLAFTRAWELAAANGEQVSLNSSGEGTTISFTVHCTPRSAEVPVTSSEMGAEELSHLPASSLRIIVVGGTSANRQLLSYYLDELPHEILEARSPEEAEELYRRSPGALIIFNDDMPEERIAEAVATIRLFEGEHMFPLASILALVCSEEEGDRMRRAGCTHIMIKPVVRRNLRHLALRLAPLPRKASRPLLPEKRVPAEPPRPEPALLPEASLPSPTLPAPKQRLMARLFGSKPQKTASVSDVEKTAPAAVQKPIPLPKPTNVGDPMPRKRAPGEEPEPRPVPERLRPRTIVRCVPAVPHAPSTATEWVGEPMPINAQPTEFIEWVGEAQALNPQSLTLSDPSGTSPLTLSPPKESTTVSSRVSVSSAHSDLLSTASKQDSPSEELSLAPKASASKASSAEQGLSLTQPEPSHAPASLSMDAASQPSGNRTLPEADRVNTGLRIETIIDLEAPVITPTEHSFNETPDSFSPQERTTEPKEILPPETDDMEIEHVLNSLDEALYAVLDAQAREDLAGLKASAAHLGQIAKEYDLRLLEDPASCLGLAVAEGNFAEITQLIPDLIAAVSKNRAAFSTSVGDKTLQ